MWNEYKTVAELFSGFFAGSYDGSFHTPQADRARHDFDRLTAYRLIWTQVHGDFKDAAKRALFQPYRYWPELYDSCRAAIQAHTELETQYEGEKTNANIMRDAMTILRERYGFNVPRWWLPIMDDLRGKNHNTEKARKSTSRI